MLKIVRTARVLARLAAAYATTCLLVVSTAVNVALAREVRLGSSLADRRIQAGTLAAPIAGISRTGDRIRLDFADRRVTVLYYFSPTCGWCERNWQNVRALARASAGRFRVVGISTAREVDGHLAARGVGIDVVAGIDDDTVRAYRLGGTPQTIVVGADGRVSQVWAGAWTGALAREVEAYFAVRLPGLTAAGNTAPR
jgi:hypothetical protein